MLTYSNSSYASVPATTAQLALIDALCAVMGIGQANLATSAAAAAYFQSHTPVSVPNGIPAPAVFDPAFQSLPAANKAAIVAKIKAGTYAKADFLQPDPNWPTALTTTWMHFWALIGCGVPEAADLTKTQTWLGV